MGNISLPAKARNLFKKARYKVFYGGRGSGKSHMVARYIIIRAAKEKLRILCAREFQNSIKESVHQLLSAIIQDAGLSHLFEITQYTIRGKNGTEFIFSGIASHTVDSIKSLEGIDICWVEEAQTVSQRSWDILRPTIRKPNSEIVVTFNPALDIDPTYKLFVTDAPRNSIVVKMNWYDNPWFPYVLKEEMEECKEKDFELYKHIWEGGIRKFSDGQIYKYHERNVHVGPHPIINPYYIIGVDLGWDDANAIVIIAFNPAESDKTYLIHQEKQSKQLISDLGARLEYLQKRYLPINIVVDQGGLGKSIVEEINARFGLNCIAAEKSQKFAYIKMFNSELQNAKFMVCRDDENTATAWEVEAINLQWSDETHTKEGPQDNHMCFPSGTLINIDAQRVVEIQNLRVGDKVLTSSGISKVTEVMENFSSVIRLDLSDGRYIITTPEHPFYSEGKWVSAKNLLHKKLETVKERGSGLKVSPIQDLQVRSISRIVRSIYIVRCIGTTLEKYQTAITSIIKTTTKKIIFLLTSNVYQSKSITNTTHNQSQHGVQQSKKQGLQQFIGISQKKAENGTRSITMTSLIGYTERLRLFVSIAVKNTKKVFLQKIKLDVALITALQKTEENQGLITRLGLALAVKNIKRINITRQKHAQGLVVLNIKHLQSKQKVYNITVKKQHNYYANGILVSNCDSVLYSWRESFAWLEKHNVKPKDTSLKQQELDMIRAIEEADRQKEEEMLSNGW